MQNQNPKRAGQIYKKAKAFIYIPKEEKAKPEIYKKALAFLYKNVANSNSQKLNRKGEHLKIYDLETYHRSNQDTCLVHKPAVKVGEWVQSGDLLADNSASMNGELAIGKNILVAYMPWEGFNYEDAILLNERLVYDDVYTSIHIERYEIETKNNIKLGGEQITHDIPDLNPETIAHLDKYGIARVGSWIEAGDILVGKVTPVNKKAQTPYQRLLFKLLDKTINSVRDSSLRAPRGIKANVIYVQILSASVNTEKKKTFNLPDKTKKEKTKKASRFSAIPPGKIWKKIADKPNNNNYSVASFKALAERPYFFFVKKKNTEGTLLKTKRNSIFNTEKKVDTIVRGPENLINQDKSKLESYSNFGKQIGQKYLAFNLNKVQTHGRFFKINQKNNMVLDFGLIPKLFNIYAEQYWLPFQSFKSFTSLSNKANIIDNGLHNPNYLLAVKAKGLVDLVLNRPTKNGPESLSLTIPKQKKNALVQTKFLNNYSANNIVKQELVKKFRTKVCLSAERFGLYAKKNYLNKKGYAKQSQNKLPNTSALKGLNKFYQTDNIIPTSVHIYLAEKRKIQVGDKMAGRHGNKGIISNILPRQDMPYLPDGTAVDIVLNPLGVPSRMNVGQIYECLLGLAGKYLGEHYKIFPFDEIYGPEASRSFVFLKLFEASQKTGIEWLFDVNSPGKIRLLDGRTGECFDQPITVGIAYMLKLVHMVDDKLHARSTGPYSLVTQQPLRGRAKQGGQRLGEMEVWAIEGYGAAFVLLEMLTLKSDDMTGRLTLWSNLILNKEITIGTPESFKVLVCELQALCLDIGLFNITYVNKNKLKQGSPAMRTSQISHLMLLP